MSRPRVLLAAESLAPGNGGICRVARLMARVLEGERRAGNIDVDAVALSDDEPTADLGLPVVTARRSRIKFVSMVQAAALGHTHFVYDFQGMSRAHCRVPLLRRPMLMYIHGLEVWEGASELRARSARRADYLLCNTAYTRDRANRVHGGFDHAKVCWLATEDDALPPPRQRPAGPPTVAIIGRMDTSRHKGHDELIACWPEIVRRVPAARLLIVGRGPGLSAMRERAAASEVAGNIEFAGFVPDGEMQAIWAQTDVFAMPSRLEGFGLVYIEAMRYGVPVIGSTTDAASEVNIEGQTGYNIDIDDPSQLCEATVRLLTDRELAAKLGENGRQRWLEHYRFSAFRERFLGHLHEFFAMGSKPARISVK